MYGAVRDLGFPVGTDRRFLLIPKQKGYLIPLLIHYLLIIAVGCGLEQGADFITIMKIGLYDL